MAKPDFPITDREKAKVYLHIMVELKERLRVIGEIRELDLQPLFVNELCHLQLRYVCELIAMACLVAQGDYNTQKAFTSDYSPPKIFKALSAHYQHFFPQPVTLTSTPGRHLLKSRNDPEAYTAQQITDLWNDAGAHLHRASLTKYLRATFSNPPKALPLDQHLTGLHLLLHHHVIAITKNEDATRLLQVNLEDEDGAVGAHWLDFTEDKKGVNITSFRAELASR